MAAAFHFAADSCPLLAADSDINSAVCNDFNVTVCEEQVNQHTVVMLSVPHPQLGTYLYRPVSRRLISKQRQRVLCSLHRKADFALMADF